MIIERITNLLENLGESEATDLIEGIFDLIKDIEKTLDIVEKESWFNFYTDIENYSELSEALKYDKVLWQNMNEYDMAMFDFVNGDHEEQECKEFLSKEGWYLSSTGLAIGFTEGVLPSGKTAVIEVKGGSVSSVYTNDDSIDFHVLDIDTEIVSEDMKEYNDTIRGMLEYLSYKKEV